MKELKILALIVLLFFGQSISLIAHEEPAKTKMEVSEKRAEAKRISKQCIKSSLAYKQKFSEGKMTSEKFLYLQTDYACNGLMESLTLYDSTGKIDTKVIYSYDCAQRMTVDADYDADEKLVEKIDYFYDEDGRLRGSFNYEGENLDSRFAYRFDKDNKLVELTKFTFTDSLEYKIDYRYKRNPDKSKISEIIKYLPGKDTVMHVKYTFYGSRKVKEKQIWGGDHKLMYKFIYQYDRDKNRSEITKVMPDGKIGFVQKFSYDKKRNMTNQDISYPNEASETQITYEHLFR
jgi:hypothetical protein